MEMAFASDPLSPTAPGAKAVGEIMRQPVVAVTPDTDFTTLAVTLCAGRHGALPVVAEDGLVLGMVSASDLLAHYARHGRQWARLVARDLMTSPAVTVTPEQNVAEAVAAATREEVHRLPVVDSNGRLVGAVSLHDLLRALRHEDEEIRARVEEIALTPGSGVAPEILRIRCERGHVVLSGHARRRIDALALALRVRELDGVTGLSDELICDEESAH